MPWCNSVVWKLVIVVSWPPCCVPVLAKTLPILPISAPLDPETACLVKKVAHLGAHVPKARRRAEQDRIGLGQLIHLGDRNLGEGWPGRLGATRFPHRLGHQLRYLEQADLGAGHL